MRQKVDKQQVRARFEHGMATYEQHAVVQRRMAEELAEELRPLIRCERPIDAMELGCGTGLLTRRLFDACPIRRLTAIDLASRSETHLRRLEQRYRDVRIEFTAADIETSDFPNDLDLIASNAAFQWVEDAERLYRRCADALAPGGILAFTTFGPEHFQETVALQGPTLHYARLDRHAALLDARFEILSASDNRVVMHFDSPRHVLRHIKATGVRGAKKNTWTPSDLARFDAAYRERFSDADGRVTLTYAPIRIIARRRG